MLKRITVCRDHGNCEYEDLKLLKWNFEQNYDLVFFAIVPADNRNYAEEVYIFNDSF